MNDNLTIFDTTEQLQQSAAEAIASVIRVTAAETRPCNISLSGGSTPKRIYRLLSEMSLPLTHVHWFWGDERNVGPDNDDSNYKMVRTMLLAPAGISDSKVHRVPTQDEGDEPAEVAQRYEALLRRHFAGQDYPRWDLNLLGMGDDAHTASLFPGTSALVQQDRWFVENWVEKFNTFRYTLTAGAINSGREIWFLIAGENKRAALQNVLTGDRDPHQFPAQLIRPTRWFVSRDAAGSLAQD